MGSLPECGDVNLPVEAIWERWPTSRSGNLISGYTLDGFETG